MVKKAKKIPVKSIQELHESNSIIHAWMGWTWESIHEAVPSLDEEECEDFLKRHAQTIRIAMAAEGWGVITELLKKERGIDLTDYLPKNKYPTESLLDN